MIRKIGQLALVMAIFMAGASYAHAFGGQSCGGDCKECHTLSKEEAAKLLKTENYRFEVKDIRLAPVGGLWEVELAKADKSILVYVDFAKKYLVEGQFTKLEELGKPPEARKVDAGAIPLADALIMGNPDAPNKVIVFSDPDCPYCSRFHDEVKKIIAKRGDIAFYIKLFPLPIHPEAYDKSRAILCTRSIAMLEDAFAGKKLPKPECEAKEIGENVKLAQELGIGGTPTLILPDGRVIPGYVDADTFISILESP